MIFWDLEYYREIKKILMTFPLDIHDLKTYLFFSLCIIEKEIKSDISPCHLLNMKWSRDWAQCPIRFTLPPHLLSFKVASLGKKKKLRCFSQGIRPRPLWRQEGSGGADEKERLLRHRSPSLKEKSCPGSLFGEVEIGYVAVIGEEPWNLFLKPDMHLQL